MFEKGKIEATFQGLGLFDFLQSFRYDFAKLKILFGFLSQIKSNIRNENNKFHHSWKTLQKTAQ